MKELLTFIALVIFNTAAGQTLEMESANLQTKYSKGDWSRETYLSKAADFRQLLEDMGGYPELGFNLETGQIEYEYILKVLPEKEVIFERVKEWAAINFGSLEAVLHYENIENGKIILKGSFDVNHREDFQFFWTQFESINRKKCLQTFVFTIVDQKLKVEVKFVRYEFSNPNFGSSNAANGTSVIAIREIYPITDAPSKSWKANLDLLLQTKIYLTNVADNIQLYINNAEADYQF